MRLDKGWIKIRQMLTRNRRGALHVLGLISLCLIIFQNCAEPLDIASQDSLSFNSQLPFAFDSTIDTIAYMSCSDVGTDFDSRAYFSFRAGAYGDNSGIRLTDDYLAATANFTPGQRADGLATSDKNAGAQLQMSIRQRSDLQSMLSSGSSIQENKDYTNILASLDSPLIAERLAGLGAGQRINYFSGISGLSGRLLEGSIRFFDSEVSSASMRDNLRDSGLLTFTYVSDLAGGVEARGPDQTDHKKVYGKGYQVDFRMGHGIDRFNSALRPVFTRGIHRVINSVQEIDLQKRSPTEANIRPWTCDNDNSFLIIRPEDLAQARVVCTKTLDPVAPATEADRLTLQALRRVLRPEDWWIDLSRRCVIPKQSNGNCYGRPSTTSTTTVKYDGGDCTTTNYMCPHYVSVCLRQ